MDINNTAYNSFILCRTCDHNPNDRITANMEFYCPRWSMNVKNVGICKYYKDTTGGSSDGNN